MSTDVLRKRRQIGALLLWLTTFACTLGDVRSSLQPPTGVGRGIPSTRSFERTATALAGMGVDTLWSWVGSGATLVWTTGGIERWRSRQAYRGIVRAAFVDVNEDASTDLFWTVDGPDNVGGMLILADGESARVGFGSADRVCGAPKLFDGNFDGRLDIISYAPGALTLEECRGESPVRRCREEYYTDWAVIYVQHDGRFVNDSSLARTYYKQRINVHRHASDRLQSSLAGSFAEYVADVRCDWDLAARLDSLSLRAWLIGYDGRPPPGTF